MSETIFAISSGSPPSGVAILRISGPASRFALETLAGRLPPPRLASLRRLRDSEGETIDHALVLWLPGPGTFTGADVAELQVHGSRAVLRRLVKVIAALPGLTPAGPGDFTRQAFLNGRMDLTGVEALGDLIGAETEAQRRAAIDQGEGRLGQRCEDWRQRLIAARAWIEAAIDFTDEADVPEDVAARAWDDIAALAREIDAVLSGGVAAERIRDGLIVVLTGPPNAGKSSLLNALVGREAAIVSDEPGTTRDLIEVDLDLGGYPVRLIDTAGLRATEGRVEREGIRRALERGAHADLVLRLRAVDGGPVAAMPGAPPPRGVVWDLLTKADLIESEAKQHPPTGPGPGETVPALAVSVHRPESLDRLQQALADFARDTLSGGGHGLVLQVRQRDLLRRSAAHLDQAGDWRARVELAGEELRLAGQALAAITGAIGTEEVLDRIFREFCIGK